MQVEVVLSASYRLAPVEVLAFERMFDLAIGKTSRSCSATITPENFYTACFGIIRGDKKPCTIKLKFFAHQVDYVRSLPLHHLQEEIESTDGDAVFSYYLRPSYDFIQKILWFREGVEVVEPISLRKEIKELIMVMLSRYS